MTSNQEVATWIAENRPLLVRRLSKTGSRRDVVEDALHDAFVKLSTDRSESSIRDIDGYVLRTAYRKVIDRGRRETLAAKKTELIDSRDLSVAEWEVPEYDAALLFNRLAEEFVNKFGLSPRYVEVLRLNLLEEMSCKLAAARISRSRSQLHRVVRGFKSYARARWQAIQFEPHSDKTNGCAELKAVVFDLQSCVPTCNNAAEPALATTLASLGYKGESNLVRHAVAGFPDSESIRIAAEILGLEVSINDLTYLSQLKSRSMLAELDQIVPSDAQRQLLTQLERAGIKRILVSSNPIAADVIQRAGIANSFDKIIGADSSGSAKNYSAAALREVLNEFDLAPNNVLSFDDSVFAVMQARKDGIPALLFGRKFPGIRACGELPFENLAGLHRLALGDIERGGKAACLARSGLRISA